MTLRHPCFSVALELGTTESGASQLDLIPSSEGVMRVPGKVRISRDLLDPTLGPTALPVASRPAPELVSDHILWWEGAGPALVTLPTVSSSAYFAQPDGDMAPFQVLFKTGKKA